MGKQTTVTSLLLTIGVLTACVSSPHRPVHGPKLQEFDALVSSLQPQDMTLGMFSQKGPFAYKIKTDVAIKLRGDRHPIKIILADLLLAQVEAPAPLVIFSHGNHSHKEAHRYQAERLASWGMHALVLQLPNEGQWLENGRTISRLINFIRSPHATINPKIERDQIILAGHSFGGSAITVAAGMGSPVLGLILLDPAIVHDRVKHYLRQLKIPVMLIGADQKIFRSRKRRYFYKYPQGDVGEISVRGATHDDAQFPSMFALNAFGEDPYTSAQKQNIFASAIAATAFSLASQRDLEAAWQAFDGAILSGLLKNPRRRLAVD